MVRIVPVVMTSPAARLPRVVLLVPAYCALVPARRTSCTSRSRVSAAARASSSTAFWNTLCLIVRLATSVMTTTWPHCSTVADTVEIDICVEAGVTPSVSVDCGSASRS